MIEDADKKHIKNFIKRTRKSNEHRNEAKNTIEKDIPLYKNLRDEAYTSNLMCDDYEKVFQSTLHNITFIDNLT